MKKKKLAHSHIEALQKAIDRMPPEAIVSLRESLAGTTKVVEEAFKRIAPLLKQAVASLQKMLDEAEIEYEAAAQFYHDWVGNQPPRFKRFLDWYFSVKLSPDNYEKMDRNTREMLAGSIVISEEDIGLAGRWLVERIKEAERRAERQKEFAETFQGLLKKYSEILPDFWKKGDKDQLLDACERAYLYFSKLRNDISEEAFFHKLNEELVSYQGIITEHEKRFIEAQPEPGRETELVSYKQEDGSLRPGFRERENNYRSNFLHWRAHYSILIDFLKESFFEGQQTEEIKAIAWEICQEIEKQFPRTEVFADKASFEAVHFPKLKRLYDNWLRKKDTIPENLFQTKIEAELSRLEKEIEKKLEFFTPDLEDAARKASSSNIPVEWFEDNQKEWRAYLMTLLVNKLSIRFLSVMFLGVKDSQRDTPAKVDSLISPDRRQRVKKITSPENLTFEKIFKEKKYLSFTIDTMKNEDSPGPLLNDQENAVLSGQATVAPVWALVESLAYRKWLNEGVDKRKAYGAICRRFGFHIGTRPEKSKKDSEGVYKDFYLKFKDLFLLYSSK